MGISEAHREMADRLLLRIFVDCSAVRICWLIDEPASLAGVLC